MPPVSSQFHYESDKAIIKAVKNHQILYDTSVRDNDKRKEAWIEIADTLNKTESECRKRWKNLRDTYYRIRKKCNKNTKWPYYKSMSFLDNYARVALVIENDDTSSVDSSEENEALPKRKRRIGKKLWTAITDEDYFDVPNNLETQKAEDKDGICEQDEAENQSDEEAQIEDVKPLVTEKGGKRKPNNEQRISSKRISDSSHDYYDEPFIEIQAQNSENLDTQADPIHFFGEHVKSVLRCLPTLERVAAKQEIFNILTKYEAKTARS